MSYISDTNVLLFHKLKLVFLPVNGFYPIVFICISYLFSSQGKIMLYVATVFIPGIVFYALSFIGVIAA